MLKENYSVFCDENGISKFPLTEQQRFSILQDEKAVKETGKKDGNMNLGNAIRLTFSVDYDRMEKSIQRVLDENDALTLILVKENGKYLQQVVTEYEFHLDTVDAEGADINERLQNAIENATAFLGQEIDYYQDISIRFRLIKLAEDDFLFVFVANHWIGDGSTFNLMIEQIFKYYEDLDAPREEKASFIDFVKYECDFVASEKGQKQLAYWRKELDGYKQLNLEPAGKGQPASAKDQFAQFESEKLNHIAQEFKTSQFNVMLLAYHIILSDLIGVDDTVIGFSCANRLKKQFYKTIGYLSRAVQHRLIVHNTDKLSELLEISKTKCNENLLNQQTSHYNDNSQFYISYQNFVVGKKNENNKFVSVKIPVKRVLNFFTMLVFENEEGLTLVMNGNENMFSADFIALFKKYLSIIVDMMYENPDVLVEDVRKKYRFES